MLLRFKAAALISAAALAAGAAVTFAPNAFAADNQTLCVYDLADHVQCAYLDVSTGFVDSANVSSAPTAGDYKWNINTTSSGYHQISTADPDQTGCMWFSGGQIMIAGCDAASYEEWKVVGTTTNGAVVLENEAYADCLNDHYQVKEVNAATCNDGPDEVWGTYAQSDGG
jgi:hypothetical protein